MDCSKMETGRKGQNQMARSMYQKNCGRIYNEIYSDLKKQKTKNSAFLINL
jgi:hypothetical protein